MVDDFNRYLDGVGVMSDFVQDVLRDSGVDVPDSGGRDRRGRPRSRLQSVEAPGARRTARSYRFLHISSAFPRKGGRRPPRGVLLRLRRVRRRFPDPQDVSQPSQPVADLLDVAFVHATRTRPDVRWIDRDLDDREIQGLYNLAHCYVHPARGEGFGLPVAEAMAAGVPVISVAYSGLADFVSDDTATTIPFQLEPAETTSRFPTPSGPSRTDCDSQRSSETMSRA